MKKKPQSANVMLLMTAAEKIKYHLLIVGVRWGSILLVVRLKMILFYKAVLPDDRAAVVE